MTSALPHLGHVYISTACIHDLHVRCRNSCKFCAGPCRCPCHDEPAVLLGVPSSGELVPEDRAP